MKRSALLLMTFIIIITLPSCADKIYLQDAFRLKQSDAASVSDAIRVESYYGGDALDYLVFELDIFNDSNRDISISTSDIQLEIRPDAERPYIVNPLNPDRLIQELERNHQALKAERKANNIVNAVVVGLNVVAAASSPAASAADAAFLATDGAIYMLDENRAYKLVEGSLEEQIQYVEEWVLDRDTIPAGKDQSWDLLFEKQLVNGSAVMTVTIDKLSYIQEFDLQVREEKVR